MSEKPIYLDTNALIKFYRAEEGSLGVRRGLSGSNREIYISSLTILEFLGVMVKYRRANKIRKYELRKLVKRLRRDINVRGKNRIFTRINFPNKCFRFAETLLLGTAERVSIGTIDCIHVAIVHYSDNNMKMVSSDRGLKTICEKFDIEVYDPLV